MNHAQDVRATIKLIHYGNWQSKMSSIDNGQTTAGQHPRVGLFVTCLVDQLWSSIGTSTAAVLERAGCTVEFDERQTCCGQPAFNTGYRSEARRVAERFIELCEDSKAEAIVSPSGSCTAMVHHYAALFPDDEVWRQRAQAIAARTFELSSFLVRRCVTRNLSNWKMPTPVAGLVVRSPLSIRRFPPRFLIKRLKR